MRDDQLKIQRTHGGETPEVYLILENTLEERVQIIRMLENEVAIRAQIGAALGIGADQGELPDNQ